MLPDNFRPSLRKFRKGGSDWEKNKGRKSTERASKFGRESVHPGASVLAPRVLAGEKVAREESFSVGIFPSPGAYPHPPSPAGSSYFLVSARPFLGSIFRSLGPRILSRSRLCLLNAIIIARLCFVAQLLFLPFLCLNFGLELWVNPGVVVVLLIVRTWERCVL